MAKPSHVVEATILEHVRLAHYCVRLVGRSHHDYAALFSVALTALWNAAKTWEPSHGLAFSTYACIVIKRDVVREIRSLSRGSARQISLETTADVTDVLATDDLITRLDAALGKLEQPERALLVARFGLDDHEPRTLKTMAAELSCSHETVRRRERRVIERLREALDAA